MALARCNRNIQLSAIGVVPETQTIRSDHRSGQGESAVAHCFSSEAGEIDAEWARGVTRAPT